MNRVEQLKQEIEELKKELEMAEAEIEDKAFQAGFESAKMGKCYENAFEEYKK